MDLRPGGNFRTVMRSPEGQEFPHVGCFLELIENEKMVMTNALEPGYRPARVAKGGEMADCADIPFTSILTLKRNGRACWDTLCAHPSTKMQAPAGDQASRQAPKASSQAAATQLPAISAWTTKTIPLPPKQTSGKSTATAAAAFYKYPMIYRAKAPPPMPPGTSQPYVQATPGVWYWPGADSIKVPVVAGFDPAIDPSKVMQW
jgi:Activator of Hsp90 ATPase homolog 1-like protein